MSSPINNLGSIDGGLPGLKNVEVVGWGDYLAKKYLSDKKRLTPNQLCDLAPGLILPTLQQNLSPKSTPGDSCRLLMPKRLEW
jgi:hypothetical protein